MPETLGLPTETLAIFIALVCAAIFIDLFAHRKPQPILLKHALAWSCFWFAVALGFGAFLWWHHGAETASLFFAGYLLEEMLSIDNLFVMMAIFTWFNIPAAYRHRVLYWGIFGAIIFRLIFVLIGSRLFALGSYVELIFAAIIGWTAIMMWRNQQENEMTEDYSTHFAYRLVHRFFPVAPTLQQHHFFVRHDQLSTEDQNFLKNHRALKRKWVATPLLLCLAVIELSDVMFAFDSVPAVIAISREPLIVYSAMIFAILGLRSLYFVLEALQNHLAHLEKAVIVLLAFIALKLALSATNHWLHHGYEISANFSLVVVVTILGVGVITSLWTKNNAKKQ